MRDLRSLRDDERGIAMVIVMLISMIILSLSVAIIQLATNEGKTAASDRKMAEAVQATDTGFADFLAILPSTSDESLCEDWDADTREGLGLDREITIPTNTGYPMEYELALEFTDVDDNVITCSTFSGASDELASATVEAYSMVGTATRNSTEVNRRFEMEVELTAIPGEGVDQVIYGASDVTLDNNKNVEENVAGAHDADIYSGCDLTTNSTSSSHFEGSLVAGCSLSLDGSYVSGNVWARDNVTAKGGSCIGVTATGSCGYGDDVADYAGNSNEDAGYTVSSQGNLDLKIYGHNACIAPNGVITAIAGGPACRLRDWVSGPDIYKLSGGGAPPGFFPTGYSCPAEAAAVEVMGESLCDDPPDIDFPGWTWNQAEWEAKGYTYKSPSTVTDCTDARNKIVSAATTYLVSTVLDIRGHDCALVFDGTTITFNGNFGLITDGSVTFTNLTNWTGSAGAVRTLSIIHPTTEGGTLSYCSTESDGTGSNGADAQDDISLANNTTFSNFEVFLYTPCHIQSDNNSNMAGQMIAGSVTNAGLGAVSFKKVDVPGQGDPIGYNAEIVSTQELPHG